MDILIAACQGGKLSQCIRPIIMSYRAKYPSVGKKKLDDDQRMAMIDALLSVNHAKRFKQPPSTTTTSASCHPISSTSVSATDNYSIDFNRSGAYVSPIEQHFRYFRRLNGLESLTTSSDDITGRCFILLPPLKSEQGWDKTSSDEEDDYQRFEQLLRQFFAQKQSSDMDKLIHGVDYFVFYLLDHIFLSGGMDAEKKERRLIEIAMNLHEVSDRFARAITGVTFDAVEHKYYINGKQMDRSVTQSLEQLFGAFNEDEAAARMIQSRNWQRNALFKAINYDEGGNQRDQETMRSLVKKEWRTRCNRGTVLHEYINRSLNSGGMSISASAINDPAKIVIADTSVSSSPTLLDHLVVRKEDKQPDLVVGTTLKDHCQQREVVGDASNPADHPISGVLETVVKVETNSDHPSAAFALWKQSRLRFSPTSSHTMTSNGANYLHGDRSTSSGSFDLLDSANVSAFTVWNQCRLNDHWLLLASEYTVYDQYAGLAGTIDAIFIPYPDQPNLVVLVDWKRCEIDFGTRYYGMKQRYQHYYVNRYPKCNYWKYAFQLNLYREMLERAHAGRLIVVDMMIVNFLPDSRFPRTFSVPRIPETRLFLDDLRASRKAQSSCI